LSKLSIAAEDALEGERLLRGLPPPPLAGPALSPESEVVRCRTGDADAGDADAGDEADGVGAAAAAFLRRIAPRSMLPKPMPPPRPPRPPARPRMTDLEP